MWTQRDQLQAYQFLRRRLVSALQVGDANHPVSPSRRLVTAAAVGAAIALLVTAGFGVYGLLRPGASSDWRKPGQVVIEKETGAAYVMGADSLLHPMLNYASARLLAGGDGSATAQVSRSSLAAAPRGVPLGIPGAPSSLPSPDRLLTGPFTVCVQSSPDQPTGTPPTTTATAGLPPSGLVVGPVSALLVAGPAGHRYAVIDGVRYRIADQVTAVALGYDAVPALPVTPGWLDAVPAGPDLQLIAVTGAGEHGPRLGSRQTRVGQVLAVANLGAADRYYLVRADGVASISQTEAVLVLGNPANRAAYGDDPVRALPVTAADVARVAIAPQRSPAYPAHPATPVDLAGQRLAACASVDGEDAVVRLAHDVGLPPGAQAIDATGQAGADAVFLPAGRAAVVREQVAALAPLGTVYLLTDQGIRFPVPDGEALKALGYGSVQPTAVAAGVLALFPAGPVLEAAAAGRPAGNQFTPATAEQGGNR